MTLSNDDFLWLLELLAKAGEQEIMPHFRSLDRNEIKAKANASDLVTIADVAAEKFITREISQRFPDATVFGEEVVSEDETILEKQTWEGLTFVIDPIDGTFNFASGTPIFGTMLAIVEDGVTIAGIIHDPVMKDWIWAKKGEGAYYRRSNGAESALHVADPVPFDQMTGTVSWTKLPMEERLKVLSNHARNLNFFGYRCAAHDYRVLTNADVHFVFYNIMMPWDHLAGVLIHQESGGYAARFDGSEYTPFTTDGGLICAPDKASWDEICRELWA